MALNSRRLLASGKTPDQLISRDEKLALQREIKEQEVLLQGYQKVLIQNHHVKSLSPHGTLTCFKELNPSVLSQFLIQVSRLSSFDLII